MNSTNIPTISRRQEAASECGVTCSSDDLITVFLCGPEPESIFSAVYDAWASHLGHSRVRLAFASDHVPDLFSRTAETQSDPVKAAKVIRSIRTKISELAWQWVYRAALSDDPGRADAIYRFLVGGFRYGKRVTSMLTEPAVLRIQELNRKVGNEAHYYREFLRFEEIPGGILAARIRPKSQVLPLLTPHFADRIPDENFLILDVGRNLAAFHPAQTAAVGDTLDPGNWYLRAMSPEQAASLRTGQTDPYRALWKQFTRSITIEQRINPALQRSQMPLRYREFAPEFEADPRP